MANAANTPSWRDTVNRIATEIWDHADTFDSAYMQKLYPKAHELFMLPEYARLTQKDFGLNACLFQRFDTIRKHDLETIQALAKRRLVVSFTSYPKRINSLAPMLRSLFNQKRQADLIVLWLVSSQFPGKESDLPRYLVEYAQEGRLEIAWCEEDLKPHKKYFWALDRFQDDVVVTVDDDLILNENLLYDLWSSYLRCPDCVSGARAHLITFDERGTLLPYSCWIKEVEGFSHTPSMQLCITGGAGALYPPHVMPLELLDADAIKSTCLHADDLWIKAMEIIANIPSVLISNYYPLEYVPNTQGVALWKTNVYDNDAQLARIAKWFDAHYAPGILRQLLREEGSGRALISTRDYIDIAQRKIAAVERREKALARKLQKDMRE